MTVDVRPEVTIARPAEEVAAFMFDPANDVRWTGGITSSRPSRPGPLTEGTTVQRTARFLGRSFTYAYEVTAADPGRMVQLRVERPFPMLIRYQLTAAGPATTVAAIHATGSPGQFFGWATPLLGRQVRRSIAADLERLRACLEGGHRGTSG
jgi:uncharacterized membrane protein